MKQMMSNPVSAPRLHSEDDFESYVSCSCTSEELPPRVVEEKPAHQSIESIKRVEDLELSLHSTPPNDKLQVGSDITKVDKPISEPQNEVELASAVPQIIPKEEGSDP
mmetsp:Transcript_7723/g.11972  ORF Transcript_7723/g.11972 Transcript_7723/m.11972 type:complete len:108 (-) Transcript_7723:146-469(-)